MVRQDWASWDLDIALPMLYHNFYRQNLEWIKFSAEQGVRESHGRFDIIAGLFIPSLKPRGARNCGSKSQSGGAKGVSVFDIGAMTPRSLGSSKTDFQKVPQCLIRLQITLTYSFLPECTAPSGLLYLGFIGFEF